MKDLMTADEIVALIQHTISAWHVETKDRPDEYEVVTDEIRRIRPMNEHRENLQAVVKDLALTNIEIWHQEDRARSKDDAAVVKAKRNIDPLNQHRNDLMEELDEIFLARVQEG